MNNNKKRQIFLLCEKKADNEAEVVDILYGSDIEVLKNRHPFEILVRLDKMDVERIEAMDR